MLSAIEQFSLSKLVKADTCIVTNLYLINKGGKPTGELCKAQLCIYFIQCDSKV